MIGKRKPNDDPKKPKAPCELECFQKDVREFVGPVRIVMLEPPKGIYFGKLLLAALLTISYVMLVLNFFILYLFVLAFKINIDFNLHVYLCTLGYQLLLYSGVLIMTKLYGPAIPLREEDKWREHILTQSFGFVTGLVGIISFLKMTHLSILDFFKSWHSITGVFTVIFSFVTVIFGILTRFVRRKEKLTNIFKFVHIVIASKVLVASSICFVTGIKKPVFIIWLPEKDIKVFMVVFCWLYTLTVLVSNYVHLLSKWSF